MGDERNEEQAGAEQQTPTGEAAPLVGEVAGALWSVLRSGSRVLAQTGRERLEAYQARKDLTRLYEKLGRETVRLVEAGEIDHPGLLAGAERIHRQERVVAEVQAAGEE